MDQMKEDTTEEYGEHRPAKRKHREPIRPTQPLTCAELLDFSTVYSTDLNLPLPGTHTRMFIENNKCRWSAGGFQVNTFGMPFEHVDAFDQSGSCLQEHVGIDSRTVNWFCWGSPWWNDFGGPQSVFGPPKWHCNRSYYLQQAFEAMTNTSNEASVVMLTPLTEESKNFFWVRSKSTSERTLVSGPAEVGSYYPLKGCAEHHDRDVMCESTTVSMLVTPWHLQHLKFTESGAIDVLHFLWMTSRRTIRPCVIYGSYVGNLEKALTTFKDEIINGRGAN